MMRASESLSVQVTEMNSICTDSWKTFRLDTIFYMRNTHSITQKEIIPDSGATPYVTASNTNNGVLTYIDCPEGWKDKGNCIMIGGKTLTFSYQRQDFCSNDSHNIALYAIDPHGANELCYLFMISALRAAFSSRYSWSDSISMKRIKDEVFSLPSTDDGSPDWEYMASYMRDIMKESEASLENLRQADKSKETIDIHSWKRFHLYDEGLFDIDMGTKLDRVKMTQIKPEISFVGRANTNNGITGRVDRIADVQPYEAGNLTLSLGGEYLGSCFIQPDAFYTSQNVVVLMPKWDMPFSVKQFVATMIFRESRTYYKAFIDELNRHIKTDFSFFLPVKADGNPDWDYMASYMRDILEQAESNLNRLLSV